MDVSTYRRIYFFTLVAGLSYILWLSACASTGTPSGGPRDTTPPAIDSTQSTPNLQTRFSDRKIELVFDEWIQTKDMVRKIVISPPMKYLPKYSSRGKKVTIEFNEEEVLKEDATYLINMGDAIGDFRENNKVENLIFVFSTGDVIDSLTFSGSIIDALTEKPVPDVNVMLYDNLADSTFLKERPFYLVKTNKEGLFTFTNIRSDTFRLVALEDQNVNYIYDLPSEKIGFLDTLLFLDETIDTSYKMELFQEYTAPKIVKILKEDGPIKIFYNRPILKEEIDYTLSSPLDVIHEEIIKDTLIIYSHTIPDSFYLYTGLDTILHFPTHTEKYLNRSIRPRTYRKGQKASFHFQDTVEIDMNLPIGGTTDSLITIRDKHGTEQEFETDYSGTTFKIISKWSADSLYNLYILPGAIATHFSGTNDTLNYGLSPLSAEKFGNILFTFKTENDTTAYVIELKQGEKLIDKRSVTVSDSLLITYPRLPAGEYKVDVLEDRNGNGRWDPGVYLRKLQSENTQTIQLEELRENWDLKAEFIWKEQP